MGGTPVRKKLELMQQIRARYQNDKNDLYHRERIVYGRTSPMMGGNLNNSGNIGEQSGNFSTFPLRLFAAAAMTALLVLSDKTGKSVLGVSAAKCFEVLSTDYESSIAAWADTASETIINQNSNVPSTEDERPLPDNPPAGVRP